MKIALCFSGLIGGMKGKSQHMMEGSEESLKISSEHIKKHIIDKNNVDVFIHSWEVELKDLLIRTYEPKKSKFEQQIIFDIPSHLPNNLRAQSHYSRWYGNKEVISLKNQWEIENSFLYDVVMVLRFDTVWYTDIIFSDFDMNYFYLAKLFLKGGQEYGWPNANPEVIDHFIFSNSINMNIFYGTIYNKLNEYTRSDQCPTWNYISHHFLIVWHFRKLGLLDLIKFPFIHYNYKADITKPYDYTLIRHYEEIEEYRRTKLNE